MKKNLLFLAVMIAVPGASFAASTPGQPSAFAPQNRLTEADRKVEAGRILLKWGGYVKKCKVSHARNGLPPCGHPLSLQTWTICKRRPV